ncbi:MAG: OmpA family protein [Akkermansiaceae bacterium]
MKPLFILFAFAAIVAFGVTCVTSMFKDYIEDHIAAKTRAEIDKSENYTVVEQISTDHFHVKEVKVRSQRPVAMEEADLVKKEIIGMIDPLLGVYAQDCEVILVNTDLKNAADQIDGPGEELAEIPKDGPPPPSETLDLTIEKEPASFSVLWNEKENELLFKGKQTNKHAGAELRKFFKEAKKDPNIRSEIKIDTKKVANSQYLKRSLREIRLLIINSQGDLRIDFQDALKTEEGQKKGFLKFVGTTGTLELYNVLSSSIKNLESDDFEVQNQLVFYPYVSIKKDAMKEKIILTGCVKDKMEQSMLGSNAGRDVANNFSTDNQLIAHDRCLDIIWHDEYAETLIAKHMNKVADGEIIYRNNKLFSLSGVSHDKDYVNEVMNAYSDIVNKLTYEDPPRKQINLVEPDPVRPETLAEQLDDYKIYFESGKSQVDPRYNTQLEEVTKKIRENADKESQIVVGGYADTSGSAAQNKILSLKRARAVMVILVGNGVDEDRIQVAFFGAESDGKTKAESRRVEIKVRKK